MSSTPISDDALALLQTTLGEVFWSDLRAHSRREALFLVSPEIPLLEAAIAVATNNTSQVERWLAAGQLSRPTAPQVAAWEQNADTPFESVVVQPFVLARPLAS